MLAYLQDRKQALRDELEKIETMLTVVASSKSTVKKDKKKGKKKLEKAVKAIRKQVTQAIEKAEEQAGTLVDRMAFSGDEETVVTPREAAPKKNVERAADKPIPELFDPKATMDSKIRFALEQKKNSTKSELIDYLDSLEPTYGLAKLKKVVSVRLNHLVKTGQVNARESKAGPRYAN